MRYELFDYQRDAAEGVLMNLRRGRDDWNTYKSRSAFALSAITGSGKTVIATAVIEALVHGSSDFDVDPDPRASFLWVTDDPALNRQTRTRMLDSSDLLTPAALTVIDNAFLNTELSPAHVYFLNIQKLSKSSGLAKSGTNLRQLSMWDVLANTIHTETTDLYLVLDEAHRGMKPAPDRRTIVQRIIWGEPGSNPPAPIVWGISATIERFTKAMDTKGKAGSGGRTTYPAIQVDLERIRASGLIKDSIGLDQPDKKGFVTDTLLRDAVRTTLDFDQRWATYSESQDEPEVAPLLVLQVPDKASKTKLAETVSVIEHEWPDLGPDAIAHVFGEHETIEVGGRTIEWVQPETVQTETYIRVLLAKEAVSTGWDCPRAEVLYSERPANDSTHIAQVIGRMVRQPLAHQIATDDALNSVSCFLPLFDRKALEAIKAEIEGGGPNNGENQLGPDVIREPKVFGRNPKLSQEVFDLIESLPSISMPNRLASPLRRARNLAMLLVDNSVGKAMLPDAGAKLTKAVNSKLDGLAAEHADAVAKNVETLTTTDVTRTKIGTTGQAAELSFRTVESHALDVDRATRRLINSLKEGAGKDYYAYRVAKAGASADRLQIRTEVAALLMIDGVVSQVEAVATKFVRDQLAKHAVAIKNTTGATRNAFLKVQEQTSESEVVTIELRANEKTATRDSKSKPLRTFEGHIFSDDEGWFPAQLNDWETTIIQKETERGEFVAWYRNPSRSASNALRIAYQDEADEWASLQVDFIVISRRSNGTLGASIVDPHGDHLADAKAKLRALADYAEQHGDRYVRIESVSQLSDGRLRVLDLTEAKVRQAVRTFEGGKVTPIYESSAARDFL